MALCATTRHRSVNQDRGIYEMTASDYTAYAILATLVDMGSFLYPVHWLMVLLWFMVVRASW